MTYKIRLTSAFPYTHGITLEELINNVSRDHQTDFAYFLIVIFGRDA